MPFSLQLDADNLTLTPLALSDTSLVIELFNDPDSLRYIGDKHIKNEDDARNYLEAGPLTMYQQHGVGLLKIMRKSDGAVMGMCGLLKRDYLEHFDIGYALLPEFRGQGVTLAACQCLINWALLKGTIRVLQAIVSSDNYASIRILHKLGFVDDGLLDESGLDKPTLLMALQLSDLAHVD